MIKKYTIFLCFISIVLGQISIGDVEGMTNEDLDVMREELTAPVPTITPEMTAVDLDSGVETKAELLDLADYFGYNYFKRAINFFDNIPTPADFKLGPGDEVILSLWGETNLQKSFVLNKDGLIYYENVGFINIANKTLEEAKLIVKETLSQTYSTLKDPINSTKLTLDLGKLKSVNVYFSGQINSPGVNLIHPFSDVFSAIIQADGVKKEGSLRSVELIRNGKIISTIDFYSFFTDGKDNFSSIRIIDGDVIHIPTISNRVEIMGSVYNPAFFELHDNETLADLITYAGGLTANSSSKVLLHRITPLAERISDDNAVSSSIVDIKDAKNIKMNSGATVYVEFIKDVATNVRILGRVKTPGYYPATTLKEVLDLAGGFNDPIYRKSIRDDEIMVLRKDENKFYGLEYNVSYDESNESKLFPDDKIFVYEDSNYRNTFTVRVEGEVKKTGTYPYKKNMTVEDAINLAEGFTNLANKEAFVLLQEQSVMSPDGEEEAVTQETVQDARLSFQISQNSVIVVQRMENIVTVTGNVYNPGLVTYTKGNSVSDYIINSGGFKEHTLTREIHLVRTSGKKIALKNRLRRLTVRPKAGDMIIVPIDEDPEEFDAVSFTSNIVSILPNLATIIFIVDSQND